jgi:uncharacterized OB-fold protein
MSSAKSSLPLAPEAEFWKHLRDGRLMIQRSRSSGRYVYYPRLLCPGTGANDLEFVEIDKKGSVYTTTVVRRSDKDGGDYNVVLVNMDEGPRFLGRVMDVAPPNVTIGMRVVASIEKVGFGLYANTEQPIIVFRKA